MKWRLCKHRSTCACVGTVVCRRLSQDWSGNTRKERECRVDRLLRCGLGGLGLNTVSIPTRVDTTKRNIGVGVPLEWSLSTNIFSPLVDDGQILDSTTMLDNCTIAHRVSRISQIRKVILNHHFNITGGFILWSRSFTPAAEALAMSSTSPVNSLIREALTEGREDQESTKRMVTLFVGPSSTILKSYLRCVAFRSAIFPSRRETRNYENCNCVSCTLSWWKQSRMCISVAHHTAPGIRV